MEQKKHAQHGQFQLVSDACSTSTTLVIYLLKMPQTRYRDDIQDRKFYHLCRCYDEKPVRMKLLCIIALKNQINTGTETKLYVKYGSDYGVNNVLSCTKSRENIYGDKERISITYWLLMKVWRQWDEEFSKRTFAVIIGKDEVWNYIVKSHHGASRDYDIL